MLHRVDRHEIGGAMDDRAMNRGDGAGLPVLTADRGGPDPGATPTSGSSYSIARLALYLAPASLDLDLHPTSPRLDLDLRRPPLTSGRPLSSPEDAGRRLRAAVGSTLGEGATVGLLYHRGLPAAALLAALVEVARAEGRRVIVALPDAPEPDGVPTAVAALHEVSDIVDDVECVVVETTPPAVAEGVPWRPTAPRLVAGSAVSRAAARALERLGAESMLVTTGAANVLRPPRLLASDARRVGLRRLVAHLGSVAAASLPAELADAVGWRRPRLFAAALAGATQAPDELAHVCTPGTLAAVERWTREWVDGVTATVRRLGVPWAQALCELTTVADEAALSAADVAAGSSLAALPLTMPYLHPDFLEWLHGVPATGRYDPTSATPYQRAGALLVHALRGVGTARVPDSGVGLELFEPGGPRQRREADFVRCVELGLISPGPAVASPALRRRLVALEAWVQGADRAGLVAVD
jgi:hypothetical protein